jgi:hypothetical protein
MIPNTSKNNEYTIMTFPMAGKEVIRALTINLMDSSLANIRNGLKALKARSDLSAENLLPSYESDMSNKAATTTKASN